MLLVEGEEISVSQFHGIGSRAEYRQSDWRFQREGGRYSASLSPSPKVFGLKAGFHEIWVRLVARRGEEEDAHY